MNWDNRYNEGNAAWCRPEGVSSHSAKKFQPDCQKVINNGNTTKPSTIGSHKKTILRCLSIEMLFSDSTFKIIFPVEGDEESIEGVSLRCEGTTSLV